MIEDSASLDTIFAPVNRTDAPGCVVAVKSRGEVIYRRGFGLASVEQAVANAPATRMRIGSSSKQFTCLAVMLMAEDGLLDIDAPLDRYLPELPGFPIAPSARQLMNHTGGYRCHLDAAGAANGDRMLPPGWAMRSILRQSDANFAPGQGQTYCNAGYHLLSAVVDRVAGIPFETFLKKRILDPLGMLDTEAVPSDMQIIPGIATLHVPLPGGGWRRGIFATEEIRGEGSLVSTVDDLLRWLAHLRGPKIVGSEESWRQMLTPPTLPNGTHSVYALGLNRLDYRGVEVVHHAGAVIGGSAQVLTVPEHALDIVILSNGGRLSPVDAAYRIVDMVLADLLGPSPPPLAALTPWRHLDGQYFAGQSGPVIGFGAVGEHLGLSIEGSPAYPVLRDRGDVLRVGFDDAALGPIELRADELRADASGNPPDRLETSESGIVHILHRLKIDHEVPERVAHALAGRYRSADLAATATLTERAGNACVLIEGEFGRVEGTLRALSADVLLFLEGGGPAGAAVFRLRREADAVVGFQVSLARGRGFRFDRAAGA